MKIIKIIIAVLFLIFGTTLSYEKVEITESKPIIDENIIKKQEEIIEENIITEVKEGPKETTTSNDNGVSTKKEIKTTTIKTNKNEFKIKNKSTKSSTEEKKNKDENKQKEKQESVKSEPANEEKPKDEPKEEKTQKEEPKPQCSDFYESITHGKVDRTSKSACISYGNKIQNNELNEVLDYNEEHGNTKKPNISYFRCYEVVDSSCNTKGWYLHFFCNSGGCDDNKLKSLYG